jgi:hypothetical protein
MQNELIQISNSLMLNEKPKNEIAYKLTDKYEVKIYEAINSMSISKCSKIEVKEVLKTCLQLSGTQTPAMDDFDFIVDFVMDNYGIFKLKELKTAFEMLAADKLSVEKHIIFNPKLIGEVMSAYKKIAVQVRQKTQINEINETPMQIDEEQAIKDEQDYWNKSEQKNWRFLNHQVFDYLWKRKQIKISKEQADTIKAKVRAVFLAQSKKPDDMLIDEETMRQQCKKYSLMMHYNNQL